MAQQLTKQLLEIEDHKHKCRQAMVVMGQQLHDYQLELNSLHVKASSLRASLAKVREKNHYLALYPPEPSVYEEQLSIEYDQTVCETPRNRRAPSPCRSVESLETVAVESPSPVYAPGTHVFVSGKSAYKLHLYGVSKGDTKIGPIPIKSGNGVTYRLRFPPGMYLDEDDFPADDLEEADEPLRVIPGCPPLEGRLLKELDRIDSVFRINGGVYLLFHQCSWGTSYSKEILEYLPTSLEVVDLR
ncbi:hypothetical protein CJU89_2557 [Yarrowia sp. B02]|nr:hypothetical protein CJU89_2557 [Yarrowia sp. B02]